MTPGRAIRHTVPALVMLMGVLDGWAATPVSAQAFGVKGGLTRSTVAFENASLEATPASGFLVGGFVGVPLKWRLSLQADALFVERRIEFESVVRDRMRSVAIPLVLRYDVFDRGPFRVRAEGGAGVGILLSAAETVSGATDDITEALEPSEISAVAGMAVDWTSRWTFGLRYLHGLTDLYTAPEFPARHRSLQVTAAFRLR